jgi:hypothetical protein
MAEESHRLTAYHARRQAETGIRQPPLPTADGESITENTLPKNSGARLPMSTSRGWLQFGWLILGILVLAGCAEVTSVQRKEKGPPGKRRVAVPSTPPSPETRKVEIAPEDAAPVKP